MKLASMTYPDEIKDEFVELRALGITMSKAAKKLGIARNTAMNWESDLKERIVSLKAIHIEELQEKYRISKEKRIELFGERFLAMIKELKERDLSKITTPKLFEMTIKTANLLEGEIGEPVFRSDAEIERMRDERILANNRCMNSEVQKEKKIKK